MSSRDVRGSVGFRDDAPVVLRERREVRASPEKVWGILAAVERWPTWHRRVGFARLRDELAPGSTLHWACDGMKFASVVTDVDDPTRLGCTLRTLGARGYLRWTLTPGPGDRTRVELDESWEGLVVRVLGGTLRRTLAPSRAEWMDSLVTRAESGEVS